jgi:AcrR family transcriptional regulator
MSNELSDIQSRTYRKRRRAELEAATRERITLAAVDLHGSIGPARTTVSAIAERAGVQRATVYRHFPDAESLFAACSQHWLDHNAPPDPSQWAATEPPDERLREGLAALYDWYGRCEQMIDLTTRDAAVVPAMRKAAATRRRYLESVMDALLAGRADGAASASTVRAAIGHAVSFETWRSLVRRQGLSGALAVDLMVALVQRSERLAP